MQPSRWLRRLQRTVPGLVAAAAVAALASSMAVPLPPAAADPPAATPPAGPRPAAAAPAAFRGYGAITSDINKVADLGFNWVKRDVKWSDIQPSNGTQFNIPTGLDQQVDQARAIGLNILLNVHSAPGWATGGNTADGAPPTDPATLQSFMQRLAARYKGRIQAYEYGNEPNTDKYWGGMFPDPVKFAQVMSGFFKGTKAGDAAAIVVTGGLSNTGDGTGGGCKGACTKAKGDLQFVMELYSSPAREFTFSCTDQNGATRSCWDAIGHHPYGGNLAPDVDPYDNRIFETGLYFMRLYQIYQMIRVFGGQEEARRVAIWATESAWLTDRGLNCDFGPVRNKQKVTAQQQADYFVKAFEMMHAARSISNGDMMPFPDVMGPLFIFHIDLFGDNPQCGADFDRFFATAPEAKSALRAMPKIGITPLASATPSPTPTQTGTPTRTPTVTPTYTKTPEGTPARKAFLPNVTKNKVGGW